MMTSEELLKKILQIDNFERSNIEWYHKVLLISKANN